jgi:Major Facilitator Superfamily
VNSVRSLTTIDAVSGRRTARRPARSESISEPTEPASASAETKRPSLALVVAVVLAAILEVLDITIVSVATPHMLGSFSATPDQINWVLTSYLVSAAVVMPLTGRLSEWLGRRRLLALRSQDSSPPRRCAACPGILRAWCCSGSLRASAAHRLCR